MKPYFHRRGAETQRQASRLAHALSLLLCVSAFLWLVLLPVHAQINITNLPNTNSVPGTARLIVDVGGRTRTVTASNLLNSLAGFANFPAVGGSATNVNFIAGQSTTPRTIGGSNTFDVIGDLTNRAANIIPGATLNPANAAALTNVLHDPQYDIPISRKWRTVAKIAGTNANESDSMRVGSVGRRGGNYQLYYGGGGASQFTNYIVLWSGPSLLELSRVGRALSPSATGWDSGQVNGPCLMADENGTNYLYYFGGVNFDFEVTPFDIGVAYSTDGTNFTKYSGNPIVNHLSTAWTANTLWSPWVIKNNGIYYLYANASGTNNDEQVGLWTASHPLGPWTAYAGNPIITNAHITADVSVIKMKDGFLMSAHQIHTSGALQGIQEVYFWSVDLTNWSIFSTSNYIANANNSISRPQSPRIFNDGDLKMVYDDSVNVYLAVSTDYTLADGSILTNIQQAALVFPSANPSAGLVLTSTSSNTAAWLAASGGSGTGMRTNQFTTNAVGAAIYGPVIGTNWIARGGSTGAYGFESTNVTSLQGYRWGWAAGNFGLFFNDDVDNNLQIVSLSGGFVTGPNVPFVGNGSGLTNVGGIKVYRALLTQAGTSAPSATVLENTLGGTVVWARSSQGIYTATLASAFTANKTFITCAAPTGNGGSAYTVPFSTQVNVAKTSASVRTFSLIAVSSVDAVSTFDDDLWNGDEVQILVYP